MNKKLIKKILVGSVATVVSLILILIVHIYIVTRPKPADEHTVVMARVDFKQDINDQDSKVIYNWLSTQKGVQHVVVNPGAHLAIFTYKPVETDATKLVGEMQSSLHYKAQRFVPGPNDLKGGCPVAQNSISYKVYRFFNH